MLFFSILGSFRDLDFQPNLRISRFKISLAHVMLKFLIRLEGLAYSHGAFSSDVSDDIVSLGAWKVPWSCRSVPVWLCVEMSASLLANPVRGDGLVSGAHMMCCDSTKKCRPIRARVNGHSYSVISRLE
ncbi:hypothetical protein Tco_1300617 [Tanacetum coccineum]